MGILPNLHRNVVKLNFHGRNHESPVSLIALNGVYSPVSLMIALNGVYCLMPKVIVSFKGPYSPPEECGAPPSPTDHFGLLLLHAGPSVSPEKLLRYHGQ